MSGLSPQGLHPRAPPLEAFAVDLDRTLLVPGQALPRSVPALLGTVQELGLRVVLVSGREYVRLTEFARRLRRVDALIAENGAVIEAPLGGNVTRATRRSRSRVVQRLVAAGLSGVETGDVVVSVPRPMASRVAQLLTGLPVDFIPNADRVMVVPKGVTKGTGMQRVLRALRLGTRQYAAIGDGENDIDLLRAAALSGAVANAHPSVRSVVDYVCRARYEAGVAEFVRGPLADRMLGGPPSHGAGSRNFRGPLIGGVRNLRRRG
jgi:hydroxymethylpyrimidine pyrophosphatase-like HAD family hydrolase